LKWLFTGIVFAMVFAYSPQLMRNIVAFLLIIWAMLAPLMASWSLLDLSSWAFAEGRYRQALSLATAALKIDEWIRPMANLIGMSESPFRVFNSLNQASSYQALGQYKEALDVLKNVLAKIENSETLDADATAAPRVLTSLALTKQFLGDFVGAENTLRRSLTIKEGKLGRDELDDEQKTNLKLVSACDLNALGRLDCKRLKWDTAESQLKLSIERLEALDRAIDPSRELWSEFAAPLVDVLMHTDRSDLAYELAQSILNIRLSCLSAHHPSLASAHDAFGRCLIISGNLERARRELECARRIRAHSKDLNASDNAETIYSLAMLADKKGEAQAAEALYLEALKLKEEAYGPSYPDVAEVLEAYGAFLERQERGSESQSILSRASEIRHKFA
jgi:tetratricopeptide (TPR) repeat protein